MDTRTGEILPLEEVQKKSKKEQKNFIPIPADQVVAVQQMNREERRKWARVQKKENRR